MIDIYCSTLRHHGHPNLPLKVCVDCLMLILLISQIEGNVVLMVASLLFLSATTLLDLLVLPFFFKKMASELVSFKETMSEVVSFLLVTKKQVVVRVSCVHVIYSAVMLFLPQNPG